MPTVFIISEYNPFHNGHAWQIRKIREDLEPRTVIAIMSGNFLQRGTPAILDKFRRAQLAVLGGCDLVVELPVLYATSSAEFFAGGGVRLAQGLDPAGTLSFGSESGSLTDIVTAAGLLTSQKTELDRQIREELDKGFSFPKARLEAFRKVAEDPALAKILESPNNILAVEYVKAALTAGSGLSFHTVQRKGLGYHDTAPSGGDPAQELPSATAIRRALEQGDRSYPLEAVPEPIRPLFQGYLEDSLLGGEEPFKTILQYRLQVQPEALLKLPEARDGLGERILNHRRELSSLSVKEFSLKVKTRRFTYTRIRRLLLHLALGFDHLDFDSLRRKGPEYARILALNPKGQEFLARSRKSRTVHLVQSAREVPKDIFRPDENASFLYSLLNPAYRQDTDFTHQLKVLKEESPTRK